jgi:serine/threonine protein kinase
MYTGSPPFEKASSNDAYYKLIKEKKMPAFWESHSKKRPYGYFSETFKDIFEKMVAFEPSERPTIYDIAKHPWVKSVICTHSEIIKEFRERNLRLNKIL